MNSDTINKSTGEKMMQIMIHGFLCLMSIICIGSFWLVLSASFQTQEEIMRSGYAFWPKVFSTESYGIVLERPWRLIRAYGVTFITTLVGTVIGTALSASAGYVISRKDYRYKRALTFYIFFTMLFNGGLVPNYIMYVNWFHLKNNILVLILPLLVNAWYIILFRGFFQSIPDSLIESAKIDGASELKIFVSIVLPISKPAIATIVLFYTLGYWNDWYLSLLYTMNEGLYKLQYLLMIILKNAEFLNSATARTMGAAQEAVVPTLNVRMAMCVLAAGPILVIFPFFQKYFVKGITVGAVKG